MGEAPFQVGGAVTPPYFVGREKEINELTNGLRTLSQDYLVIAPRRVGKTTLLCAIKKELRPELLVVYLNCREIATKVGFVRKLISTILIEYESKHKISGLSETFRYSIRGKILEAMRRIEKVGGSLGKVGEVYLTFREGEINENELLEQGISFLEDFSKEKKVRIIILLDEFQKLYEINGFLFEVLKSKMDLQENIRYVISGSSISMLDKIFLRKDSPLYMMFTRVYLQPLDKATTKEFVKKRLQIFDIKITDKALNTLHELTSGIPYYVQKLGYFCFDKSQLSGKDINDSMVLESFDRMLIEFDEEFEFRFIEKFSPKRQSIIKEMSKADKARISGIAKSLGVDVNYLGESMHFLVESMVLKREKRGYYDFFDPVFKSWLRREFGEDEIQSQ